MSAAAAGEERIEGLAALFRQPCLENSDDLRSQRRTPCLAPFAETTDMSAAAKIHVLPTQRGDLAVAQVCLDGELQECPIPSSDPCSKVRSVDQSSTFFLGEKHHWSAIVTFGGYRQDALAVVGECRFIQGDIAEERVQRAQAVVSCTHTVQPIPFEVVEELRQESRIKLLHPKIRRLPAKMLRSETQQQAKRIAAPGHRVRAGT